MELHERARDLFARLQDEVCAGLEALDGRAKFREDRWEHGHESGAASGGGVTRVLSGGRIFEKAGVNLADVGGALSERLAARLRVSPQRFEATGVSLVIHPLSPMVPTVHMNLRHIGLPDAGSAGTGERGPSWFGGGADLTPYYLFEEDVRHFHATWRSVCDRHDPDYYPRFKNWCDEYFHVEHRGETRGVGGIFFDYLDEDLERAFDFVEDVGRHFLEAYVPIVERRVEEPWWDAERSWQLIRRGRYVEFNLVYDRGTLFGLETRGRTESILMSLPPLVRWTYDHQPEAGSREAALLGAVRGPRDWA
jgi:coproporphyrinogen III oxidase